MHAAHAAHQHVHGYKQRKGRNENECGKDRSWLTGFLVFKVQSVIILHV